MTWPGKLCVISCLHVYTHFSKLTKTFFHVTYIYSGDWIYSSHLTHIYNFSLWNQCNCNPIPPTPFPITGPLLSPLKELTNDFFLFPFHPPGAGYNKNADKTRITHLLSVLYPEVIMPLSISSLIFYLVPMGKLHCVMSNAHHDHLTYKASIY